MEKIEVCNFKVEKVSIEINNLTTAQRKYVEVIEDYKEKFKKVPSIREIGSMLGYSSPRTITDTLKRLENKGYIYSKITYNNSHKN